MNYAAVGPISTHFPDRVETNEELQRDNPKWDMELIASKTGIYSRHIAAPGETSSDLGVAACQKLFRDFDVDPQSIDFLLFCTQTPDYPLPTTACLMQERLGLPTNCGALDFNLGCSGYPYGLAIADGLIRTGVAKRILFVTAETYSKFIDKHDRSVRTIFGDAAAASLIVAHDQPSITGYKFGTDGSGANTLCVANHGFRDAADTIAPRNRKRWVSDLYMDGPSLITFTINEVPKLIGDILASAELSMDQLEYLLIHQATLKMLQQLQQTLGVEEQRMPIRLEHFGNTVSSTLPILIEQMRRDEKLAAETNNLLVGFGVGWSWSGCVWQDVLQPGAAPLA